MNSPTETLVASDAALRRMAATPTIPVTPPAANP
jgi:hypothetical protein